MSSSDTLQFDAAFKKVPGTLSLTKTHIAWNATTAGAMDRQQQAMNRVTKMLASRDDAPHVSLKLLFKDNVPDGGLLFKFTSASKKSDRQAVQDRLVPFVSANKEGGGGLAATPGGAGATTQAAGAVASGASSPAVGSTPGTPGTPASVARKRKADEGPAGDAAARRRMNTLRERVLRKDATLKLLHRELVMGKRITEDEFWDGREALLKAEAMVYDQLPGRASRLIDDRHMKEDKGGVRGGTGVGVKKTEAGPTVLNLNADIVRDIFEEFPVVEHAYAVNVPTISETDFWRRYFESTLWERHRASARKSTLDENAGKKDPIFDVYLEDPDWETEPRGKLPDTVEKYLDLAATEEDHGENAIVRDVTMQAGKGRDALPLIRRFNNHSGRLVQGGRKGGADGAGVAESGTSTPGAGGDKGSSIPMVADDLYDQIDFEDLHAPAAPAVIPLEVQDAVDDDKGGKGPRGILPGKSDGELLQLADAEATALRGWHADFGSVCMANPANPTASEKDAAGAYDTFAFQRDAQFVAQRVVRDMHIAANTEDAVYRELLFADVKLTAAPLPEKLMAEMRSCHAAAAEFLRQYWAATLPPAAGTLATTQSAQARAARAAKMARYLEGTQGKVNAIVTTAEIVKADPERVRAAMAPTLGAVDVVLRREKARAAKPAA